MTLRLPDLPADLDVRLVVSDMDGTLLDADGEVPDDLWPLLEELDRRGIVFCPASGRQYASLLRTFHGVHEGMVFIAENGAYVVQDGHEVSSVRLDVERARAVVTHLREVAAQGLDCGVVWCARERAYVERGDRAFLDDVEPYYASLAQVPDLLAVDDEPVKLAVWTSQRPDETTAPALAAWADVLQVVVSSGRWVDVMPPGIDKGVAVRRLQAELGVTAPQTVVFGDMPNDLEMIDAAELSFAMGEAHPEVVARARHRAPSHRDHGVVRVLRSMLAPR